MLGVGRHDLSARLAQHEVPAVVANPVAAKLESANDTDLLDEEDGLEEDSLLMSAESEAFALVVIEELDKADTTATIDVDRAAHPTQQCSVATIPPDVLVRIGHMPRTTTIPVSQLPAQHQPASINWVLSVHRRHATQPTAHVVQPQLPLHPTYAELPSPTRPQRALSWRWFPDVHVVDLERPSDSRDAFRELRLFVALLRLTEQTLYIMMYTITHPTVRILLVCAQFVGLTH